MDDVGVLPSPLSTQFYMQRHLCKHLCLSAEAGGGGEISSCGDMLSPCTGQVGGSGEFVLEASLNK